MARVVVTREPEWDDMQRQRMQALEEYERGICSGCGFHSSIADEDPYYTLEERVCPICAGVESELRAREELEREHDDKHNPGSRVRKPGDGRTRFLRLLSPDEAAGFVTAGGAPVRR